MTQTPLRLSKRVAELRACSRREAEQYIEGGWVRVDGQVVEEPQFRVLHQAIEIDGEANLMALTQATLLLNKPPGVQAGLDVDVNTAPKVHSALALLNAANQLAADPSGARLLKRHLHQLSCPVPLETGASGLLVCTQDWRVQRKLADDAASLEHEIIVEVAGQVSEAALQKLNYKLGSHGQPLPQVKASINSSSAESSKLRFAVKGSHPGLIAWLCDRAQLQMLGMKRIRLGRVALATLPVGQWRFLQAHEIF